MLVSAAPLRVPTSSIGGRPWAAGNQLAEAKNKAKKKVEGAKLALSPFRTLKSLHFDHVLAGSVIYKLPLVLGSSFDTPVTLVHAVFTPNRKPAKKGEKANKESSSALTSSSPIRTVLTGGGSTDSRLAHPREEISDPLVIPPGGLLHVGYVELDASEPLKEAAAVEVVSRWTGRRRRRQSPSFIRRPVRL